MIDQAIDRASASGVAGRHALLERSSGYLAARGYRSSTQRAYLDAAAHLLRWLAGEQEGVGLNATTIECFLTEHLPVCRCTRVGHRDLKTVRAALNRLLEMLGEGRCRRTDERAPPAIEASIAGFDWYLRAICGLAEATRRHRCSVARTFLRWRFGALPLEPARITAPALIDFVSLQALTYRPASLASVAVALRSYLRFLQFCGEPTVSLRGALPRPPHYSLAGLPSHLDDRALGRFWAAFERSSAMGKRDYAMARCLADLGLRCGEVASLSLEAIDWRRGQLRLAQTKARREEVLPLPASTAQAVLDYLRHARPETPSRALFVYHRAPLGQPVRSTTVRGAVRRAFARAALPWSGPHVLRHTLATRLLEHGVPLSGIADVLRHRSLDTTWIYTKVDRARLAEVALPWPGRSS